MSDPSSVPGNPTEARRDQRDLNPSRCSIVNFVSISLGQRITKENEQINQNSVTSLFLHFSRPGAGDRESYYWEDVFGHS